MEYTGPKINGVSTRSISKRSGIPVDMISNLCGVDAVKIGFPGKGPSCTEIRGTYSSVSIEQAYFGGNLGVIDYGSNTPVEISFDSKKNKLYGTGKCGEVKASTGYYALEIPGERLETQTLLVYWDSTTEVLTPTVAYADIMLSYATSPPIATLCEGEQSPYKYPVGPLISSTRKSIIILYFIDNGDLVEAPLGLYSDGRFVYSYEYNEASGSNNLTQTEMMCPIPPIGPINISPPDIFANISAPLTLSSSFAYASRGTWTGDGDISYTYEWYSDGVHVNTQGPFPYTDSKGNTYDSDPYIPISSGLLFTNLELVVSATDNIGTTTASASTRLEDSNLNTFLANSGISSRSTIAALEYLQKELITGGYLGESTGGITDYYPFAGETEAENKWSLGNPSEYLTFDGNWAHSLNGSQSYGGTATSTKIFSNSVNLITFALGVYISNEVAENSIDASFGNVYGNWTMSVKRRVGNESKFYWGLPNGTANTNVPSLTSKGLSGLYRYGAAPPYNMLVINGGTSQLETFSGTFQPATNYTFVLGGTGSTKNFQFAFNGNFFGSFSGLETIIQNYNSMLGR